MLGAVRAEHLHLHLGIGRQVLCLLLALSLLPRPLLHSSVEHNGIVLISLS